MLRAGGTDALLEAEAALVAANCERAAAEASLQTALQEDLASQNEENTPCPAALAPRRIAPAQPVPAAGQQPAFRVTASSLRLQRPGGTPTPAARKHPATTMDAASAAAASRGFSRWRANCLAVAQQELWQERRALRALQATAQQQQEAAAAAAAGMEAELRTTKRAMRAATEAATAHLVAAQVIDLTPSLSHSRNNTPTVPRSH